VINIIDSEATNLLLQSLFGRFFRSLRSVEMTVARSYI